MEKKNISHDCEVECQHELGAGVCVNALLERDGPYDPNPYKIVTQCGETAVLLATDDQTTIYTVG